MLIAIKTDPCPACNEWSTVIVEEDDYGAWVAGLFVQDAFPYLNADSRELLMTGTHPECWESIFTDEEKW
jgi:hypothetical protein